MSEVAETIRIECECGKKLKVPAAAAGKRVKCPNCQTVMTVPMPEAVAAEATDADDLLAGLGGGETVETERPAAPPLPVLTAPSAGSFSNPAADRESRGGPDFGALRPFIGIIACAVVCAIGAGVWYGIAISTGYEIGYLAWAVGAGAGLAIYIGSGTETPVNGIIAAVLSILAIVVGKYMIFAALLFPIVDAATPKSGLSPRDELAHFVARENCNPKFGEKDTPKKVASKIKDAIVGALPSAQEEVKAMSDEEVRTELQTHRAEFAAVRDETKSLGSFGSAAFGIIDIVFLGLAVVSAYRLGANGLSVGESSS